MKFRVYNKTLNPKFWDENKNLKPGIGEMLLKIAYNFYENTELQPEIKDVYFLGSMANYNHTPQSDVDLHILIDMSEMKMDQEYARKFTKSDF